MKRGLRARFFAALLPALSQGHARVSEPWRRKLLGGLAGTVLEIGPGTGINLAYLPDRVYWLGLEPNPHLHPWLETALRQRGVLGEVLLGQAEEIPLPQESVDAVVATLVLCSVEDPRRALAEILRVLRPGGRFVFLEHVAAPQCTLRVTGVPAFAGPRISSVPLGPFWGMVAIPTGKPWPLFGRQGLPGWKRRPLRVAAGKAHPFKGGMKGAPGCPSFRPLMLAVKCT